MKIPRKRAAPMLLFAAALALAFFGAEIESADLTADPVIPASSALSRSGIDCGSQPAREDAAQGPSGPERACAEAP
ncbi:MAG: hypothetical protein HY058_16810 [Proteobacteria bacterium]|nr:hypothetical protein [Pseudomonadota bacterium]